MRSLLLSTVLLLAGASAALAQQDTYSGDAAAAYHWMRANAGPGQCGCFGMNGGGLSGSWNFRSSWSAVVDISAQNRRRRNGANNNSSLDTYLAGARYKLPQPWLEGNHKPQPFAQIILGAAHAGGGEAGVADGSYKFATRIGAGIDVPLSAHQNNLLVGAGIVYHWSRQQ